ncbi:MAG: hypothetical protein AUG49_07695 [Catenulispora sp. 13_1_20CM_3_70_7]|nr:MAG: hypothetical protein AUG49_07695 [Catenulispora sp. 13_1_20CM_3_70_7]
MVLGVVTTDLLNTSEPLPLEAAQQALKLLPGVAADSHRHPVEQAVSPDLFYGVDCRLATKGSARVEVVLDASTRRMPWSYYAACTGTVEAINKADPADLVSGFLKTPNGSGLLDLGGIGTQVMALLDDIPQVDGRADMRTVASRLRWAVLVREGVDLDAEVVAGSDGAFQVRMTAPSELVPRIVAFCEILALHQWLLAALKNAFDRAGRSPKPMDELDPALSYLGHVWNPTAHLPTEIAWLWEALEHDAQLTWEWESTVTRVRDKLSLLTRKAIEGTLHKEFL